MAVKLAFTGNWQSLRLLQIFYFYFTTHTHIYSTRHTAAFAWHQMGLAIKTGSKNSEKWLKEKERDREGELGITVEICAISLANSVVAFATTLF